MSITHDNSRFSPGHGARPRQRFRISRVTLGRPQQHIKNGVWAAYSNLKTAFRRREAAKALLEAADQSYKAALKSYYFGVRNLSDVTDALRTLAQGSICRWAGSYAGLDRSGSFRIAERRRSLVRPREASAMICKTNMRRFCLATLIALMSSGCSQAPAIDVMGSLFPAWLLCIALGILAAAINHWLLLRYRIQLLFPFLAYPCLAAVYTFAIWLVFF